MVARRLWTIGATGVCITTREDSPLQEQRYSAPERRPTICLIVDVANIPEDAIMSLVQEVRRRGELAAMFAFADWHRRDMHLRHRLLDALGFLCIHGGSWENGSGGLKSTVDSIMKRAIKWMPQWFPTCDTYVLATGDRDFAHDASDLRWRGLRVWIAAGEASINNELRLGADEFISLDRLSGKAAPSALLGVPPNYYETSYGARARAPRTPLAPVGETGEAPPPRRTSRFGRALAPPPVVAEAEPTPAPVVSQPPVLLPAIADMPPPAVVSDEAQRLLDQLRQQMGPAGYLAQREALRALVAADDPGGRMRSRISNQIRELVERGQLMRTHVMLGGNLTQVLALPGVTVEPTAAEPVVEEAAGERRGRLRRPRSRDAGAAAPMAAPAIEEQPAMPLVAAVAPVDQPASPPPPAVMPAPVGPAPVAPVVASQPPMATPGAEPVVPNNGSSGGTGRLGEGRRAAERRPRPALEERPTPPAVVAEPAAPVSRPSWREAVAAALAQVRGTAAPPATTPPVAATPPVTEVPPAAVTAPVGPTRLVPAATTPPPVGEPSAPAEVVDEAPEVGGAVSEAGTTASRRRRRRRPAAPVAAAAEVGEASEPGPVPAPAASATGPEGEVDAEAGEATGSARRRPNRRRVRRPTAEASGEAGA